MIYSRNVPCSTRNELTSKLGYKETMKLVPVVEILVEGALKVERKKKKKVLGPYLFLT